MPTPIALLILLIIGIVLILLEAVLPHGISFLVGVGVIGFSIYLCFRESGPAAGIFYFLLALSMAGTAVFFSMKAGMKMLTLRPPKSLKTPPAEKGRKDEEPWPKVGQEVEVVQPLHPTGTVIWEDRRFPARTIEPEHESKVGDRVRVQGRDSIYVIVDPT